VTCARLDARLKPRATRVKLIDERSGGGLTFNFASLYATLYKLEERGLVQGGGSSVQISAGADSPVIAAAVALLAVTALMAAFGPALRAARIDLKIALQAE
jgi:ABC-type antimicrobial peptide transport system permease subunit